MSWSSEPESTWIKQTTTTRTRWMANNAIPDSIIMNMMCRSLVPAVKLNEANVRSTGVASISSRLDSKNTLRILNTIKPVTRAFTAIDASKPVKIKVFPQWGVTGWSCSVFIALSDASQVTSRGDKLKLEPAYRMKIDGLTYGCDCQEWRNDHDSDILTPHNPTTVDLWRLVGE